MKTINHLIIFFLSTLTVCLTSGDAFSSSWSGLPPVITDPYQNSGTPIFKPLTDASNQDILPNVVAPFVPSGNVLENWMSKEIRNAPDIGAVEGMLIYMAQVFSGKSNSGETGILLWKLSMSLVIAGLLWSGILIFMNVYNGKKRPGEGIIGLFTKVVIALSMITFVVPNIPSGLIGACNSVTRGIDNWFGYVGNAEENERLLETIYKTKMSAGMAAAIYIKQSIQTALLGMIREGEDSLNKTIYNILKDIEEDPKIRKVTSKELLNGWEDIQKKYHSRFSSFEINSAISDAARVPPTVVFARSEWIAKKHLRDNTAKAANEAILAAILAAPKGLDLTPLVHPGRAIGIYAYLAFIYLTLSIWGLGFAALIWTVVYSLPEELGLDNPLFKGIKLFMGIVLTAILVSIYISASLHWTNASTTKIVETAEKVEDNFANRTLARVDNVKDGLSKVFGEFVGNFQGIIPSILSGETGIGSAIGRLAGLFTTITLEQFMIGLLILTAPAQAGGMLQGANAMAENINKAMNAKGASDASLSGLVGAQQRGRSVAERDDDISRVMGGAFRRSDLMKPST